MTSSARALVLAALVPLAVAAAPPSSPPAALAARVAARVADTWGVPVEQVCLAWGRVPAAADTSAAAPVELVGRGVDGWFAVVLRPPGAGPVALRARAGTMRATAVAARAVAMNATLTPDDVRTEERVAWGPPAPAICAGAGWTSRRPLAAGDVLEGAAVAPPTLVRSGDAVTLVWSRGSVRVSRPGIALNGAHAGGLVHVRPAEGPGRFTGVATAPGTVTLTEGGRP